MVVAANGLCDESGIPIVNVTIHYYCAYQPICSIDRALVIGGTAVVIGGTV